MAEKDIKDMTQAEIDAITAKQVAEGAKSVGYGVDNRINGESFAAANARITAAYKNMTAKPILTADQEATGLKVQYVRTQAGGVGEYTVVKPLGYTGEQTTFTEWTAGILPSNMKYTKGTSLGKYSTGLGTVTSVAGANVNVTETGRITHADGSVTIFYSNGTSRTVTATGNVNPSTNKTVVKTTKNPDGSVTTYYSDGTSDTSKSSTGNNFTDSSVTDTGAPTTNIDVLKAVLRGRGFNSKLIDASASYLQQLLKDGLDYDNAVEVFLSSKDYTLKNGTKVTSPFYSEYGYLNESSPKPLTPDELYGFVEGTKNIVTKYALNPAFATPENLKKYIQNGVTVTDIESRANTARLKALESDTSYIEALKKLGFIASAADLTDFYLDPKIGQDTLEQNKRTGTFAAEAVRRANQGIEINKTLAAQQAAGLTAKGLSEAQIGAAAAQGYAAIGEQLNPLNKLTGIYERTGLGAQAQNVVQGQLQSELEQEQFMGMASARRKRLAEQEAAAFQAAPGTGRYSLSQRNAAGLI